VLLVGPYDPHCGEYTFLAPPLGVWRLAGFLESLDHEVAVFDPNCCARTPEEALIELLRGKAWDVIGVSTTGMTLRFDLSLAHLARRHAPDALLVAGGMEATFSPERLFELGPFDFAILGEGEKPLREILRRRAAGRPLDGVPGTAMPTESGAVRRCNAPAMTYEELRDAIRSVPYARMPYTAYWERLERAYRTDSLPFKAEREARLAEIRSVRLITLNYCPMACSFCSSTNFLHSAQGSVAKIARLTAEDCLDMIERIVVAQPAVRTVIFQDDIFVFTKDKRVGPLCDAIVHAKKTGRIPSDLQFISTNRIDAMDAERLRAMKMAGFRVLGFGVESFAPRVLAEFNKAQIHPHIEPVLSAALDVGLRPFLDLILCSPHASLDDVAETVREAYRWILAGCEVGLYPYVIPFSGAQMALDPALIEYTVTERRVVPGTDIAWDQPAHIMPIDVKARSVMREIVAAYEDAVSELVQSTPHIPSRTRSLLWIATAIPFLAAAGQRMPPAANVLRKIDASVGHERVLKATHSRETKAQLVASP
jgi:radical SAM superfamily enzyme YgiQ (UPF0313 family)